ncbi:MAG: hypothetical protein DRJ60_00210 [Thermoprotei archaeon]|nr:MAG: hypothetical protein DRJ60_00210 [Thermoprotei archaeon]
MPEIDVDRALELSEKLSNAVGSLLSIVLIVQMMGDLLGINVIEALKMTLTRPWVIPVEWIEMYYPLWYAMQWALLILMLSDQVFTMRYMQSHKAPPPPSYERYMSLAIFIVSFWLAILFRYMTFTLITVFASISLSYTMFIRKG